MKNYTKKKNEFLEVPISAFKAKRAFVFFSADDKYGCVDSNGNYYYHLLQTSTNYLRKYKDSNPANFSMQKNQLLIVWQRQRKVY